MDFEDLKKIFINKKRTLGSVESFTGGLFANNVTSISGASNFFKGALVTYATEEKESLLGIDKNIIDKHGVVSKEIAVAMAKKGCKVLNVDYCVSFTGNAGPLAMEGKPVGMVFIGLSDGKDSLYEELHLDGSRDEIRDKSVLVALDLLKDFVK